MRKRVGVAVWVSSIKTVRHLKRFGNIHFVSKRYKYVVLYVDADTRDETIGQIKRFNFVTNIEPSYRHEIPTEYNSSKFEKMKELEYQTRAL